MAALGGRTEKGRTAKAVRPFMRHYARYELLVDLDNSAGTHGAAYPIWIHPNGDPLIEILGRSEFALA